VNPSPSVKLQEQKSSAYHKNKRYTISEQNYRYRKAEIDIITIRDDFIAFVEVKARSSPFFWELRVFCQQENNSVIDNGNRRLHSK
tara:strand:+ start:248 stop:505 length:258 start_codon:yes stop_codon:yes gene_type:complete